MSKKPVTQPPETHWTVDCLVEHVGVTLGLLTDGGETDLDIAPYLDLILRQACIQARLGDMTFLQQSHTALWKLMGFAETNLPPVGSPKEEAARALLACVHALGVIKESVEQDVLTPAPSVPPKTSGKKAR